MSAIEKTISHFIKNQFPAFYREEGETFVQFVTEYYKWMESEGGAIYNSRRILDFKDIDETLDEFVIYFKNKYLADIQLDTVVQTKNLIKHSLDIYRAKGTPRSVDLFFRSIYGTPAEVYYPGDDIFRLSDGTWVKPKYLEVTPSQYNKVFVGTQIRGVNSDATAYVERYIRRKIKGKYVDVLYISAINGEFVTNETLTIDGQVLKGAPLVIGSLTTLDVISGGRDFKPGDILKIESDNGVQGKGRVVTVSDVTGTVDFNLEEAGWGYSANAEILISEKVLYLSNVTTEPGRSFYFDTFETIKQPLANVTIINADSSLNLTDGDMLYTYYSNNSVAGKGRVMSVTRPSNTSTNAEVFVAEIINNLGPVKEPGANLTGTVSVTYMESPLYGVSSINVGSNTVTGNGTLFTSELRVGSIIKLYAYDANNKYLGVQTRKVSTIANDTSFTLSSNSNFTSPSAIILSQGSQAVIGTGTSFVSNFSYGDDFVVFSNSTNYEIRAVDAVVNSTFLTLQEGLNFINSTANYTKATNNFKIYTESNAISANISTRTDRSVTANVMGISANADLYLSNVAGTIAIGQQLYQLNANNDEIANATVLKINRIVGSNVDLSTANLLGVFVANSSLPIKNRLPSGSDGSVTSILNRQDLTIGVIGISTSFTSNTFNYVVGTNSNSNATIVRVSSGFGANFALSETLQFSESLTLGDDLISMHANVPLNAFAYGFIENPAANGISDPLNDILKIENYTVGGIASLSAINPGKNYDVTPFITVYEPRTAAYDKKDLSITITAADGIYTVGELVENANTGYIEGIVKESYDDYIVIGRVKFNSFLVPGDTLTGVQSGVTSTIVSISEVEQSYPIGLNGIVSSNVQTSKGAVSSLEVVDSGFGYLEDESVSFISSDGLRTGTAKVNLGRKGVAQGYYRDRKGQLSSDKYLHDGEYYQDYSYVVRSAINSDKYFEMLKKVIHVAGTKMFAETVISNEANTETNITTDITVE